MYVQWGQLVTLFPVIEAGERIALQALLAFGHHLRHRAALQRLAHDHRDALANLREALWQGAIFFPRCVSRTRNHVARNDSV